MQGSLYTQYANIILMRKVVIEMDPRFIMKILTKQFFETVVSIEVKALLKLDVEKLMKINIIEIKMKPGYTLEDIALPKNVELLDVLKSEGNTYLCLSKAWIKKEQKKFFGGIMHLDLDFLPSLPASLSKDKVVFSFIADEENIKKIVKAVKLLGKVRKIDYLNPVFSEHDILSCLTQKQQEVILAAKGNGYYDYPRKTSPAKLAKQLGISKGTMIEHLRKAENRLIAHILAGH